MTNNFQQSLSNHVARLTNNGESIVAFLKYAMNDESGYFKPNHRLRAAGILAQHSDDEEALAYLRENPKTAAQSRRSNHRQATQTQLHLSQLVRETTGDGLTIIQHLVDVMQGRNPSVIEGLTPFKPHHRMTAAQELIKLGCCHSTLIPEPVTPKTQPTHTVIPAKAGIHVRGATGQDSPLPQGEGQGEGDSSKTTAKWIKRIKEEIASLTKEELNPPLKYIPNATMWKQIGMGGVTSPPPGQDFTECLQRFDETIARQAKAEAAKKERQAIERERQRNDNDNHDDG